MDFHDYTDMFFYNSANTQGSLFPEKVESNDPIPMN